MKFNAPRSATLIELLGVLSPDSSKNTLRSWIEKGRVTVDGQLAKKANLPVNEGQEVQVGAKIKHIDRGVEILYEDRHLVVINKPEGLLSVDADNDPEISAHELLKRRFHSQRVYPVHRLDRETSGVMLFAYSESARDALKEKFKIHDIQREYYAIITGELENEEGTWESYLIEDQSYVVRTTEDASQGRHSITHYRTISKKGQFTLLRLTLETGRKNQIRVHCQAAGCSIVGDKKYGSLSEAADRLCLHASKLGFEHPILRKFLVFDLPLPEVFSRLVKA